jgi:SAM-dependent methyltransferase
MSDPRHDTNPRVHWEQRYRTGPRPWDTGITPPEVHEFWNSGLVHPSGIALDMGCGTGTNVRYLASLGLHSFGLELSFTALSIARERVSRHPTPAAPRTYLVQSDVSAAPLHGLDAVYVLDIGCLHAVPRAHRSAYAAGVIDNLAPGGYYHLFAHDRSPAEDGSDDRARGLDESEVVDLFTPALSILSVVRGNPDQRPCRWYLLRKPGPS